MWDELDAIFVLLLLLLLSSVILFANIKKVKEFLLKRCVSEFKICNFI